MLIRRMRLYDHPGKGSLVVIDFLLVQIIGNLKPFTQRRFRVSCFLKENAF
jgi:hypothetical protein